MRKCARIVLMIATWIVMAAVPARAADLRGPGPHTAFSRGVLHYVQGDYALAETDFRKALKETPSGHCLVPAVRHHLGKALMARKRYKEAAAHLRPLTEVCPENAKAVHTLALALFFSEAYEECPVLFEKAARLDPALSNEALYYAALAHLKLGNTEKGHAALRLLSERSSAAREARYAEPILAFLDGALRPGSQEGNRTQAAGTAPPPQRREEKPWSLFLSMGMEYDDNVSLIPDSTVTLPEGISSRGAWRFVTSAGGSWEFLRTRAHRMEVDLSYSGTGNRHLSSFDVDTVSLGVPWRYTFAPFQVRLSPRISQTWVASERYSWSWGLSPGFSYQPVRWTWTDLNVSLSESSYFKAPPDSEEDRDALSQWVGLQQSFSFPDLLLAGKTSFFSVGASFDANQADGSAYDNRALGGSLVFQQGLWWDMTLLAQGSYREIHYENPHVRSPEGEKRSDDEVSASVRLFKKIRNDFTLYAGYRWYENDSNLSRFYEYQSDVFFFGLRFDL